MWFVVLNKMQNLQKIKDSLYSRYCAEACNDWRGLPPWLSARATLPEETSQRWRAVGDTESDLAGPGTEC